MKCKSCGADLPVGAKKCPDCNAPKKRDQAKKKKIFCSTCGDEVSPQWNYCFKKHPLKLFCPACGKASPGNATFCLNCGGDTLVDSEEFKKLEAEKKQNEEDEKKQRAPKCPDCGQEITPQQIFCTCGYAMKFICSACEEMNPRESSACRSCGSWELINPRLFRRMKEQEKEAEKPKCDSCGEKVDAGQTFCLNCHEPLKKACKNCGGLSSIGTTICVHCGSRDLLDPRATKKFENLVVPGEVQVNQEFVISGQVVSFVGTPGDSLVYLKLSNGDEELETGPDQGVFEFYIRFSEIGEYGLELRSGVVVKKNLKIKAVRRLTPAEEIHSRPPMKRLCIREAGVDGSDWTCDTPIIGGGGQNYKHFCPSKGCDQNQELKFTFLYEGKLTVFDKFNCEGCESYEIGIDKFFLDHNDNTFFRTMDRPARYIPEDPKEILKQACLYECPVCRENGKPGVKKWALVPETWLSRKSDKIGGFIETASDLIKRGFKAAKAAREEQSKKIQNKNGGNKK